jgi:integrase
MARKLTGSVRRTSSGGWEASVPERRGSTGRVYAYFSTEFEADLWRARAVAAVQAGDPIPSGPDQVHTDTLPEDVDSRGCWVERAADAWANEHYEEFRKGGAERHRKVQSILKCHIVPFWSEALPTPGHHSRKLAKMFVLRLTGSPNAPLTVAEAAELAGCSTSSLYRHIDNGSLATVPGHHRNAKFVTIGSVEDVLGIRRLRAAYAPAYVADIVKIWSQIETFMRDNDQLERCFAKNVSIPKVDVAALRRAPRQKGAAVSLRTVGRVAAHLHVIHQVVLWIMRICGLRIGEAYGIEVGDIVDWGTPTLPGLIRVDKQGGRNYLVRDDAGNVTTVDRKDDLKTSGSVRVLAVPPALMSLIRIIVTAFHTDPDTGEINVRARLVPGIQTADTGGQQGFRNALKKAIAAAGLDLAADEDAFVPHDMRAALITDLSDTGIGELERRAYVGHVAGSDVHSSYIRRIDREDRFHVVAAQLQQQILDEVGSLMVPTLRRPGFGRKNPIFHRKGQVMEYLIEVGWQAEHTIGDDVLLDADEVAIELDCTPGTARRRMQDTLPTVTSHGQKRVPQEAVGAYRDSRHPTLKQVAAAHDADYHRLYRIMNQLDLTPQRDPDSDDLAIDAEIEERLLEELRRVDALHARACTAAVAASRLRLAQSTVRKMLRKGELPVDPETDATGARFIPNDALDAWIALRS